MKLKSFASSQAFRAWLEQYHRTASELLVRCYKVQAKLRGLTYREALDEALCFGWIDGVRRSVDTDSFSTRFTPRKPRSKWSIVNIRRAKELETEGRMHASGRAAFAARNLTNSRRYSFEEKPSALDRDAEKRFRANQPAWKFFQAQAPWYRRTSIFWVMDARREETRARRLAALIASSAKGEPVKPLSSARLRKR
jgi:uncharacterized protein YdeI (YjbR/CyaY-like superfamily)